MELSHPRRFIKRSTSLATKIINLSITLEIQREDKQNRAVLLGMQQSITQGYKKVPTPLPVRGLARAPH